MREFLCQVSFLWSNLVIWARFCRSDGHLLGNNFASTIESLASRVSKETFLCKDCPNAGVQASLCVVVVELGKLGQFWSQHR